MPDSDEKKKPKAKAAKDKPADTAETPATDVVTPTPEVPSAAPDEAAAAAPAPVSAAAEPAAKPAKKAAKPKKEEAAPSRPPRRIFLSTRMTLKTENHQCERSKTFIPVSRMFFPPLTIHCHNHRSEGNVIAGRAGQVGFNVRARAPPMQQMVAQDASRQAMGHGLKEVEVLVRGRRWA